MRIKKKAQAGFTMVELSIVMVVFAMIMLTIMGLYSLYNKQRAIEANNLALQTVQDALIEFVGMYGVYPCPAVITQGPGNANYGRETRGVAFTNPNYWNTACTSGQPLIGLDTPADIDALGDPLLIGAVPFNTLLDPDNNPATADGIIDAHLIEDLTMDAWNHKIVYAVTQNLTQRNTYSDFIGAIEVVDENNQPVLDPNRVAHVVLLSHGENSKGAYTREGNLVSNCVLGVVIPPGPPPVGMTQKNEIENCDWELAASPTDGKFLSGLRIERDDSYNDDIVKYFFHQTSNLWIQTSLTQIVNTNPTRQVGIGTNTPAQMLDVAGDLTAQRTRARQYCDQVGNCMPAATLGGTAAAFSAATPSGLMQCPAGQVLQSIDGNQARCRQLFTTIPATTCPAGQYIKGFTVDSTVTPPVTTVVCCDPTLPATNPISCSFP